MLDKATIQAEVKSAFTAVMNDTSNDREGAIDTMASRIADAVIGAIRSAEIVYTSGLAAPPGGGPVTGTFQGSLR